MRTTALASVLLCCVIVSAALIPVGDVCAKPIIIIHSFKDSPDGAYSRSGMVRDKSGNFYGTTVNGGANDKGTIFKIEPNGSETVLYSFAGGSDGALPYGGLAVDSKGNLYGTTINGGEYNAGTIFELASSGAENVLYAFGGAADGAYPEAGVIRDKAGNLYGTTVSGGADGAGNVFMLAPNGTETTLYSFTCGTDGCVPYAGLIEDTAGNLYGTASEGGTTAWGVVFEIVPGGSETTLYSFTGGNDGGLPYAGVIMDHAGNLYGTTVYGGSNSSGCDGYGCGTVFKLAPDGTETVLYSFTGGSDGAGPEASLLADKAANVYSTTIQGGSGCDYGCGTVFKVTPAGRETVLHAFTQTEGADSVAPLVADSKGNLYGTAQYAGNYGYGSVFKIKE